MNRKTYLLSHLTGKNIHNNLFRNLLSLRSQFFFLINNFYYATLLSFFAIAFGYMVIFLLENIRMHDCCIGVTVLLKYFEWTLNHITCQGA